MPATHAMDSYVGIEDPNAPGTYIDVSTKATNARLAFTKQDVDSSTFGQGDMTNVSGLRDATFSLDVYGDATLNQLLWNIFQSRNPVRIRYGPEGSGTGKERYTAYFNMSGWEPGGSVTSLNGATVNFHRTGATTRDVF